MEIIQTRIKDLVIIKPSVFPDERGYFFESWNKKRLEELGFNHDFIQDNESKSAKGILRGMHFQKPPFAQGKLVRVIKGAIVDVGVDLRKGSPTYLQHVQVTLSEENKLMFFIPEGFAHGFLSKEEGTIVNYKCTQVYHKASEVSFRWDDPTVGIAWDIADPELSERDSNAPFFKEIDNPF